jgi:hypothetical protein
MGKGKQMITKAIVHFDSYTKSYNISKVKPESEVESIEIEDTGLLVITYNDGTQKGFLNMPTELTIDNTI